MGRSRTDDRFGPVQVLLIGIDERGSDRMLAAELQDLRNQDAIRVLDMLQVLHRPDGEVLRLGPVIGTDLTGTMVEALLVAEPDGGEEAERRSREPPRSGDEVWFLADRLPRGAAAAILLIEHRWAIPLREAASEFEAQVFGDAWVHPRDLAAARRSFEIP